MRIQHRVAILAMAAVTISGCGQTEAPPPTPKPPGVVVSAPVSDFVTDYEDFTGRTDAVYSIDIRARVTGYLDKVYFKDGDEVKEGDLLFEIDPRPYEAELARTEATILQGLAHLTRLEADHRRVKNLYTRGNVSREEFDKISGDRSEAEAMVGIAKAARDLSQLNVAFTKIRAPISGRLSRRLVDPGNLVKGDETILTSIVSLDPMYVYFDMDERTLLKIRRLIHEGKVKTRQEAEIHVMVGLSDEEGYPHQATINFSDNRVDPNTGTLRVRGVISNPPVSKSGNIRVFSPGMFARVRLPIGSPHKELMVPEEAIGTDQGRKYLFVVKDEKRKPAAPKVAHESKDGHEAKDAKPQPAPKGEGVGIDHVVVDRTIEVGPSQNGLRVVTKGLKPGEMVIVSGLQRVRPGAKVEPKVRETTVTRPAASAGSTAAR